MIFLCGLIGIFDCIADRKSGPFLFKGRKKTVLLLDIALPVWTAAVISLFTLFFAGKWKGTVEIWAMFVYSIIVILWCLCLSLITRNEKALAAVLPLLILCSLILAPVFLDLSSFLPVFRIFEKLIPVTYYLRLL